MEQWVFSRLKHFWVQLESLGTEWLQELSLLTGFSRWGCLLYVSWYMYCKLNYSCKFFQYTSFLRWYWSSLENEVVQTILNGMLPFDEFLPWHLICALFTKSSIHYKWHMNSRHWKICIFSILDKVIWTSHLTLPLNYLTSSRNMYLVGGLPMYNEDLFLHGC